MSKTLAPVASLLLGIAFLVCGNGLQGTLIPLRAAMEGFSVIEIGLMGSAYYAGFVAGCLAVPYLIRQAGHIRTFVAIVSGASAVALIHPLAIDPVVWILARALTGFALAGFYLIVESWLNDRATNDTRGLLMSAYIIVNYGTITVGQMLVTVGEVRSFELFALSSILVSIAALPVALSRLEQPAPMAAVRFRPLRLYRIAPVGIVGSFAIGVTNGSFWALGTLFATDRGLDENAAAVFMSMTVLGGALLQWPVGRISDLFDRRRVLVGQSVVALVITALLVLLPLGQTGLMVMALLFGASTLTGYSIAAAHAYDRADPASYVEMAAGILLAYGLGSVVGPLIASPLMEAYGADGLFLLIPAAEALLIVFVLWRLAIRSGSTGAEKESFEVYSTAPVGGPISRDGPANPDEDGPRRAAEAAAT